MTQTISVDQGSTRGSEAVLRVILKCESRDHGLLEAPVWEAAGPDYIEIRKRAAAAGWKRAHGGIWLCPACAK